MHASPLSNTSVEAGQALTGSEKKTGSETRTDEKINKIRNKSLTRSDKLYKARAFFISHKVQTAHASSILRCPVLETLLVEYYRGFPDITKVDDSCDVNENDIHKALEDSMNILVCTKNKRVTLDSLAERIGRLVLEKRVLCPVSLFQQIFIYVVNNQLDTMLDRGDPESLIYQLLNRSSVLSANSEYSALVHGIVVSVHDILFRSIIKYVQEKEFEVVEIFLQKLVVSLGEEFDSFLHNDFKDRDQVLNTIGNTTNELKTVYEAAFRCWTKEEVLQLQSLAVLQYTGQFKQLEEIGWVMTAIKHMVKVKLSTVFDVSNAEGKMMIDSEAQQLASTVVLFAKENMRLVNEYIQIHLKDGFKLPPPAFLVQSLDNTQNEDLKKLYTIINPVGATSIQTAEDSHESTDGINTAHQYHGYSEEPQADEDSSYKSMLTHLLEESVQLKADLANINMTHEFLSGSGSVEAYEMISMLGRWVINKQATLEKIETLLKHKSAQIEDRDATLQP